MKKLISIILTLILFICTSTTAFAYDDLISFDAGSITFFTDKSNVGVYSEATTQSDQVDTIWSQYTAVQIDGIYRNFAGHIWLRVAGRDQYIKLYDDQQGNYNLIIDFPTLISQNYGIINSSLVKSIAFANLVRESGKGDYKHWLDPSNRGISYKVMFGDLGPQIITAEQLGNIHYGFLGSAVGFTPDTLKWGGGMVNIGGLLNPNSVAARWDNAVTRCINGSSGIIAFCAVGEFVTEDIAHSIDQCTHWYCDAQDDILYVERGIRLFYEGSW